MSSEHLADKLYVIILAAGEASRFGSPKQLALIKGKSFIRHSIDCAAFVTPKDHILVVTGAHEQLVKPELTDTGVQIIHNPHWQEGMGKSIVSAINQLPSEAKAVLIMTCDQVLISKAQIQQLKNTWLENPSYIVASQYADTLGIPAIFPNDLFAALQKLPPNSGAKHILQNHEKKLIGLDLPQAQYDIDSKQDMIEAGLSTAD